MITLTQKNVVQALRTRAEKTGVLKDLPHIEEMLQLLELIYDEVLLVTIERQLDEVESQLQSSPFIEPEVYSGIDQGDHHILNTCGGKRVCFSIEEGRPNPVNHITIAGAPGMGKTSLMANIAAAVVEKHATIIVDSNRTYRNIQKMRKSHNFVRASDLRLNLYPNISGVSCNVSDQVVTREVAKSFGLQWAEYEISEVVRELRKEGIPSLPAVIDALSKKRYQGFSRRSQYRDSALLILNNLMEATGDIFRCKEGMDIEELLSKNNLVIESDDLLPIHQAFLCRFVFEILHLLAMGNN